MLRATLRGLLARKLRLALSGVAVILGVAFVSGTFVLTDTLGRVFEDLFAGVNKGTAVTVRSQAAFDAGFDAPREPVSADLVPRLRQVAGVADVRGGLFQLGTLVVDGKAYKTGGAPTAIIDLDPSSPQEPVLLRTGHGPTSPTEVAIDAATVRKAGLSLGDRVGVIGEGGRADLTLVGTTGLEKADSFAGAALLGLQPETAQRLSGRVGKWDEIHLAADPGVSQAQLRDRVAPVLPKGVEAITAAQSVDESTSQLKDQLSVFNTILLAFGGIALFVGAFLIFNTFSMLIAQRTRELALMRALGASRGQVTRSVLVESLVVGVFSSLVGFGLGIAVALGLRALLGAVGVDLPAGPTVVAQRTFWVSLLVGTGITSLAALLPARRAARVAPVQAMRDSGPAEDQSLGRRTLVGAGLAVGGVGALAAGLTGSGLALVGLGAALSFVAVATLSPLFARPVVSLLGTPFARLGVPSRLGRGNATRSPRRTSSTAAALMIGLALVAMVSVFGASAKTSLVQVVARSLGADYVLHTEQYLPFAPQVADTLRRSPEFASVAAFRSTSVEADGSRVAVQGVDPQALEAVLKLDAKQGSLSSLAHGDLAVSENVAKDRSLAAGDRVTVRWVGGTSTPLVVGAVYGRNEFAGDYLVGDATYAANVTSRAVSVVAATRAPGVSAAQARSVLDQVERTYPDLVVQDQAEFIAAQGKQVDQLLNIVTVMLVLSVLIAVLGIVNTLALSVVERTRELGLLRAVGLQRRQLRRMIRVESVLIAVYGAVLGIAVGLAFGFALLQALKDQGLTEFSVPVGRLVQVLLVGGLAGVVAAALPARRAAKMDVLQAISHT